MSIFMSVKIDQEKVKLMLDELKSLGITEAKTAIEIMRKYADDIFGFGGLAGIAIETADGMIFNSLFDLLLAELSKIE